MEWNTILLMVCGALTIVGAVCVAYQLYCIVAIDAKARGLKHPRLLGFITIGSNNNSGLLLYLIGRRKYPMIHMPESDRQEIVKRKKSAGVGLVFLSVGAIGMLVSLIL